MSRDKRNLLILGAGAVLLYLAFAFGLFGCQRKPDATAELQAQVNDLTLQLQACQATNRQYKAQLDYDQIGRTPASSWPTDSLTRFLTNYGLHPESSRSPQRR